MKLRQSLSSISVTLALVFLASGTIQAATNDLAALQGEWLMVSGVADGQPMPDFIVKGAKRTCEGDQITAIAGGQLIMKAKITLDAGKKPKTIDYDVTDGPNKGKQLLGIYELNAGTFKSCFAAPGGERPKTFESNSGDLRTFTIWTRKSADKAPGK